MDMDNSVVTVVGRKGGGRLKKVEGGKMVVTKKYSKVHFTEKNNKLNKSPYKGPCTLSYWIQNQNDSQCNRESMFSFSVNFWQAIGYLFGKKYVCRLLPDSLTKTISDIY